MQRLRAAQRRGHRLVGRADDVDVGLLGGERGAGGLRVEAQHLRAGVFGAEALAHDLRPEAAGGAELGDLLEEHVMGVEEEGELAGEGVDIQPGVERGLDIGDAVGEGEADLLGGGGAGLADVVAGDGDGVPLGNVGCGVAEDVGDDAHRGGGG